MERRLFVGNLPYETSGDDLRAFFENYGTVVSARVITDKETGRSRGFGFVEMATEDEAQIAIAGAGTASIGGRKLTVNEAQPRPELAGGRRGGGRSEGARREPRW